MTIDGSTLISYTAALMAVLGGLFAFFWSREERSVSLLWFCLPFLLAIVGTGIAVNPTFKAGEWGPRIGTLFLILACGFAWQMVRVFYGRRPLLLPMFAAMAVWLVLSATVFRNGGLSLVPAAIRTALVTAFTGLAAYVRWSPKPGQGAKLGSAW
ncbi:hypothetical protein [Xanthobacter sediminis]